MSTEYENKVNFTEYLNAECKKKTGFASAMLFCQKGRAKHLILDKIAIALIAFMLISTIVQGLTLTGFILASLVILFLREGLISFTVSGLRKNLTFTEEIDITHLKAFLETNLSAYGYGKWNCGEVALWGLMPLNSHLGKYGISFSYKAKNFCIYIPNQTEKNFGTISVRFNTEGFFPSLQYKLAYKSILLLVIALEYYGEYESNANIKESDKLL